MWLAEVTAAQWAEALRIWGGLFLVILFLGLAFLGWVAHQARNYGCLIWFGVIATVFALIAYVANGGGT